MNATDVLAMLRRYYLPEGRRPAGLFADEIGSPCGLRRADLIWVPTTATETGMYRIIGHEIKVSRADVLSELADPTKADPWARYCDRWWLVVSDPTLIDGLTLPDGWGVMAPPSGRRTRSMTILRPAPRLQPRAQGPAVTRLAAYVVNRVETQVSQAQRDTERAQADAQRAREEVARLRTAAVFPESPHARRISQILNRIEEAQRADWWINVRDDDIVAAAVDLAAARVAAENVRRATETTVRQVEQIVQPFRNIADLLTRTGYRPAPVSKKP